MTEKIVSLSGGLALGMAFALFLGVSTTQNMTSPLRMEYPSVSRLIGLNDLQSYRSSSSSQASDTTPAISVAPPAQEEDRGRIIRIATVTETADHIFLDAAPASSNGNYVPKTFGAAADAFDAGSTLQQMHRQHSYIAASTSSSYASVGQIARQTSNFASIADNGSGANQGGDTGGSQPSVVDTKPRTSGTPAIAQNDPGNGEGEGEEPAVAGLAPRPPDPDTFVDDARRHVDPSNPGWNHDFHEIQEGNGGHHPDPQGTEGHHSDPQGTEGYHQEHRPEVD